MREHDLGHALKIIVQKRRKDLGIERLDQRGEAGDVCEKSGNLATLPGEADPVRIAREALRQVR